MSKFKKDICIICASGPAVRYGKLCNKCARTRCVFNDKFRIYQRQDFIGYSENLYGVIRYIDALDINLALVDNNPLVRYVSQFKKQRQSLE